MSNSGLPVATVKVTVTNRSRIVNLFAKVKNRAKAAKVCTPATIELVATTDPAAITQAAPNARLIVKQPLWIDFKFINAGPFMSARLLLQQTSGQGEDKDGEQNFPYGIQQLNAAGTTLRVLATFTDAGDRGDIVWSYVFFLRDRKSAQLIFIDPEVSNEN